jgi:hypothetical protein
MKIKFLKNHLKHKTGDVAFVDDAKANYFIRAKVAVPAPTVPVPKLPADPGSDPDAPLDQQPTSEPVKKKRTVKAKS